MGPSGGSRRSGSASSLDRDEPAVCVCSGRPRVPMPSWSSWGVSGDIRSSSGRLKTGTWTGWCWRRMTCRRTTDCKRGCVPLGSVGSFSYLRCCVFPSSTLKLSANCSPSGRAPGWSSMGLSRSRASWGHSGAPRRISICSSPRAASTSQPLSPDSLDGVPIPA